MLDVLKGVSVGAHTDTDVDELCGVWLLDSKAGAGLTCLATDAVLVLDQIRRLEPTFSFQLETTVTLPPQRYEQVHLRQ